MIMREIRHRSKRTLAVTNIAALELRNSISIWFQVEFRYKINVFLIHEQAPVCRKRHRNNGAKNFYVNSLFVTIYIGNLNLILFHANYVDDFDDFTDIYIFIHHNGSGK